MSLWTMFSRYWFWPVFALLVLYVAMMIWPGQKWSHIEQDVARLTQQELVNKGFTEATVVTKNRGREVLINATVRSEEEKQTILDLAASASDSGGRIAPRTVEWNGFINEAPILSPAQLNVLVSPDTVVLSGVLSSQAAVDSAVLAAQVAYPTKSIENQLTVADNIEVIGNVRGLLDAFRIPEGQLSLDGKDVTLVGMVTEFDIKRLIGSNLEEALGAGYTVDNKIRVVPAPAEPSPVVVRENLLCQERLEEIMAVSNIYFESASAEIQAKSSDTLDRIVEVLSQCPAAEIEVAGHTDSSGQDEFNMTLSQQRAESVSKYLTDTAQLSNTITAFGYGETQPIADNSTESGRAENRRIQFIIK